MLRFLYGKRKRVLYLNLGVKKIIIKIFVLKNFKWLGLKEKIVLFIFYFYF